jgi:hypothetical protein
MKTRRVAKKSSARTKHQIEMDRRRNGQCITCGGAGESLTTGVGVILFKNGECGRCRFDRMANSGGD